MFFIFPSISRRLTKCANFRGLDGDNSILLHKNLLAKIEKEFNDEIGGLNILLTYYKDKQHKERKAYELTFEFAIQLLMSESKIVRKYLV